MSERKTLEVLLLGASFSTRNMGVAALASSAVACAVACKKPISVVMLDYAKEAGQQRVFVDNRVVEVELVNMRFSKKLHLKNNIVMLLATAALARLVPSRRLARALVESNETLSAIDRADFACSLAGGDSFSDVYGLSRFAYTALPNALMLLMKKDLVMLPQTYGPFNGRVTRAIAVSILRRTKALYSRGKVNAAETQRLVGRAGPDVEFCPDMAFALSPRPTDAGPTLMRWAQRDARTRLVGLNVSGLLYMGGYTGKNMFGLKTDYPRLIDAIIRRLMEFEGVKVALISHVFGGSENTESDVGACAAAFTRNAAHCRDRLFIVSNALDQHEVKHVIGKTDFFIGSRMHACIAAISQCVPTIGIAYSDKFKGVFKSVGLEDFVVDPRDLDESGVLALLDACLDDADEARKKLEAAIPSIKERLLGLFDDITASIAAPRQ